MIDKATAESALARARRMAARGATLDAALTRERVALIKSIDAELSLMQAHAGALRPAAQAGDTDASAKLTRMTELQGDLRNARAALEAQ